MFDKFPKKSRLALSIAAGGLSLSACAHTGNVSFSVDDASEITIADAFIDSGSTFRTDPGKLDDGAGGVNFCVSERRTAVAVEDQIGLMASGLDSNGPWIGFKIDKLPDDIRDACSRDEDGIVWVVRSQVLMNDTFTNAAELGK